MIDEPLRDEYGVDVVVFKTNSISLVLLSHVSHQLNIACVFSSSPPQHLTPSAGRRFTAENHFNYNNGNFSTTLCKWTIEIALCASPRDSAAAQINVYNAIRPTIWDNHTTAHWRRAERGREKRRESNRKERTHRDSTLTVNVFNAVSTQNTRQMKII